MTDTMKVNPNHYSDFPKGIKLAGTLVTTSAADLNDAGEYIYIGGSTGDLNTLIGDAKTLYVPLIRTPIAMSLVSFHVRTEAKETTANATMDVIKAASGTAIGSGTAMVTQKDPDTLTNATDAALTVKTDGSEDLAVGDMMFFKVVSGAATSTLKHLAFTAKLRRSL